MIIDDIVPGHTGKGADFRLAEMKVGDFPGIYHMVEIEEKDWHLLPKVPRGRDSVNLDTETEAQLAKNGYIIGRLQRVIFYESGVKDTNWSVTDAVVGPDGVERRWVYLHYFKEGQPSINWLDPSFAGIRLVIGDALHSLGDLGSGALRLDANGFLGVEKSAEDTPAWSEGHPLSEAANQLIASMVRKVGGFTFQELNLTVDDIKSSSDRGADLSYDFVNRPAYHHAMATADTEFVRLTLNLAREMGVEPASLVHALQNHDEMTYELVHFATLHRDQVFTYHPGPHHRCRPGGADPHRPGRAAHRRSRGLQRHLHPERDRLDHGHRDRGLPRLHLHHRPRRRADRADPDRAPAAGGVQRLAAGSVRPLGLGPGGGVDPGPPAGGPAPRGRRHPLDPSQRLRPDGLSARGGRVVVADAARRTALYGSLPAQLDDPDSFARRLAAILEVRRRYGVATAFQLDVPPVSNKAMLVMVHQLSDAEQITVLNFSAEEISGGVRSERLVPGSVLVDMVTDEEVGEIDDLYSFGVRLGPYEAKSLLVLCPGEHPVSERQHDADKPSVRR